MAKNKMTVSIQGPALVNADKNMLRAVKKALITVGKIGAQEVRQSTPVASGFLRSNIREQKPEINRKKAEIWISAGWTPKTGEDVVYAHFIETGKRWPGGRQTTYGGKRMFGRAADILRGKLKTGSKFQQEIVAMMNGKKAA
jgi:hypothetical protein